MSYIENSKEPIDELLGFNNNIAWLLHTNSKHKNQFYFWISMKIFGKIKFNCIYLSISIPIFTYAIFIAQKFKLPTNKSNKMCARFLLRIPKNERH